MKRWGHLTAHLCLEVGYPRERQTETIQDPSSDWTPAVAGGGASQHALVDTRAVSPFREKQPQSPNACFLPGIGTGSMSRT